MTPTHSQRQRFDIPSIKDSFDLRVEFAKYFPDNIKSGRLDTYLSAVCPWHNDHRPSMIVFESWIECKACGVRGDIIEFEMQRTGCSFEEACEHLSEDQSSPTIIVRREVPKRGEKPTPPFSVVEDARINAYMARPYFQSRAVTDTVFDSHFIGAYPEEYSSYVDRAGTRFPFKTVRYAIPYLIRDEETGMAKVSAVKLRRDDAVCYRKLNSYSGLYAHIQDDLARKWKVVADSITPQNILDECFMAKYYHLPGYRHKTLPYNLQQLIRFRDGREEWRTLSHLLVVEGELDCLALNSAGYLAIGAKYSSSLDFNSLFRNVAHVYVVADREADKQRADGTWFNPGRENANKILSAISGSNKSLILPPVGFKDANDLAVAGLLDKWLWSEAHIEPCAI